MRKSHNHDMRIPRKMLYHDELCMVEDFEESQRHIEEIIDALAVSGTSEESK